MSEPRVLPTREGYDRWAAKYDTMGNWLLALEEPEVDQALGDVAGLDILDVGAGTGRHAIRLAAQGARVTAVDFSAAMLARARAKDGAQKVRWLTHDVDTPLPFADRSFDRVVTRTDGRIVVTAMHPAMFLKGISANFHDDDGEIRPRSYDATLADYLMGAIDAGLRIVRLSEHPVDETLAARYERSRKLLGWPALLVLVLCPA